MLQKAEKLPSIEKDKVVDDGESSDDGGYETDEEWHTFAMSDTQLILPNLTQPPLVEVAAPPRNVTRSRSAGITIREPTDTIRLASPTCHFRDKGKVCYGT
ncbi:unnamed protein product [Arabis nemorensis]|uniref:Uncharacterized protein n=1 Tax=Arabis nemorensis TaxID=586526 RepID=A0A565BT23_9BRAS|nr:unnamed protein product [Arabis nemorensis]